MDGNQGDLEQNNHQSLSDHKHTMIWVGHSLITKFLQNKLINLSIEEQFGTITPILIKNKMYYAPIGHMWEDLTKSYRKRFTKTKEMGADLLKEWSLVHRIKK